MGHRRWAALSAGWSRADFASIVAILAAACWLAATTWVRAEEAGATKPAPSPPSILVREAAGIPSDATLAIVIRPAELAQAAIARPILAAFDQLLEPANLGLKVSDIEEFKVVFTGGFMEPGNDAICAYMILRSRQPHDWKKAFGTLLAADKEVEIDGHTYIAGPDHDDGGFSNFWCPDARTVIAGTPSGIARTFSTPDPIDRAPWADSWSVAVKSPLAVMLGTSLFKMFDEITITGDFEQRLDDEFAALTDDGEFALVRGDVTDHGFVLGGDVVCRSVAGAERVAAVLQKLLPQIVGRIAPPSALDDTMADQKLSEQMSKLVAATTIAHEDTLVHVESTLSAKMLSAIGASLQEAAESQSHQRANQKKLEQLAAAMNKYHDANGHYPLPVILGPDGKTSHSWRVAILPYLEGGAELSARYRMDQPWDSDHNRQVMLDGAELFAVHGEEPAEDSPTCGYFVIAGKGTLFDGENEPTRQSVTDEAAATILLVEARRPIPWTKPEDISYDPAAALPELGGHVQSMFAAAFVDGSVRLLANGTDEATLRAMFTKAAGDGAPAVAEPE
jgi:hypothetical protein